MTETALLDANILGAIYGKPVHFDGANNLGVSNTNGGVARSASF
jgi:hypothetical protein